MQRQEPNLEAAKELLLGQFYDEFHRPYKIPKTVTQLELSLEDQLFYWTVDSALAQLAAEGRLQRHQYPTTYAGNLAFYFPPEVPAAGAIRHIPSLARLIDRSLHPRVTAAVGTHLEGLVRYELRVLGFEVWAEDARRYQDREWIETEHELDWVVRHRSGPLALGVEVKNTLTVIPKEELDLKIRMCQHLGLRPVFAVRWLKPFAKEVARHGGYSWMFKTQIYPPGFQSLVKALYDRLTYPVTVRTDIPPKTVPRFAEWILRNLTSPA